MKRDHLIRWLDDYLEISAFDDPSLNGLQVEGAPEVETVAVAVDSSFNTIEQAVEMGADLLIVHHGLFWGSPLPITGPHKRRVSLLLENDISLYAAHLPLDAHREVGNNWGFARMLDMEELEEFGTYRGRPLGVKGRLPERLERRVLAERIERQLGEPVMLLEGGPQEVETLGIISGDAARQVTAAAREGLDAFLTGEPRHEVFYEPYELGINALYGGHYMTETIGVNLLAERLRDEFSLETRFIYLPTGL